MGEAAAMEEAGPVLAVEMGRDLAEAIAAAKELREAREDQVAAMNTTLFAWLERFATAHHRAARVWEAVKKNPLKSTVAQAMVQALSMAVVSDRAPDSEPDATTAEEDLVSMTKLQFLEQELAQLKAMMAAHGVQPGVADSNPAQASQPVADPEHVADPEPVAAAPEPITVSPVPTPHHVQPPAASPTTTTTTPPEASAATPRRPCMVSIVQQASAVKLRAVEERTPTAASTPGPPGLERVLKSALATRFNAAFTTPNGCESDTDSSAFSSPEASTPRRPQSARAPARRVLQSPQAKPAKGMTTGTLAASDDTTKENQDGKPLSKSMPPAVGGGAQVNLLQAIRGFNKTKLKKSESEAGEPPLVRARMTPAGSSASTMGAPPPPPKKFGAAGLMAELKSVKLRPVAK